VYFFYLQQAAEAQKASTCNRDDLEISTMNISGIVNGATLQPLPGEMTSCAETDVPYEIVVPLESGTRRLQPFVGGSSRVIT
jgi:hypothetical protein